MHQFKEYIKESEDKTQEMEKVLGDLKEEWDNKLKTAYKQTWNILEGDNEISSDSLMRELEEKQAEL